MSLSFAGEADAGRPACHREHPAHRNGGVLHAGAQLLVAAFHRPGKRLELCGLPGAAPIQVVVLEHYNLNGGRPREAAEFETFARAMESGDQELCTRMQDTSIAVSRVLTVARRSAGIRFPGER